MPPLDSAPSLELVTESKIYALLPGSKANDRLEASGVYYKDDHFYVIFDNAPHIARLEISLAAGDHRAGHTLLRQRGETAGFEDITFDPRTQRYLSCWRRCPSTTSITNR